MAKPQIPETLAPDLLECLHVRYLEPAKGEVRGEAKVVRMSGRSGILECRLTCGDHLVALSTANFAIKAGLGG